jgi:hypothetical protein
MREFDVKCESDSGTIAPVIVTDAGSDAAYAPAEDTSLFAHWLGESFRGSPIQPGALVSLWDMLRIHAKDFVLLLQSLDRTANYLTINDGNEWSEETYDSTYQKIISLLDDAKRVCGKFGLKYASPSLARIRKSCEEKPYSNTELQISLKSLGNLIKDELNDRVFMYVPTERTKYFPEEGPLFGASVQNAFPKMTADIEDAGWCLTVGRGKASVYHLMCVMEHGIRFLATKRLKVLKKTQIEHLTWQKILDPIYTAIASLPTRTSREKAKQERLSEAVIYLKHVKDAWRNPTMHVRRQYTLEESERVFECVKAFTVFLATKLINNRS